MNKFSKTKNTSLSDTDPCYLEIIIGPMWGGKTTRGYSELLKISDIGLSCLCIGPEKDTRSDTALSSHNEISSQIKSRIVYLKLENLIDANSQVNEADAIMIDEANFFPDLYDTVISWLKLDGKYIIVCGLDGDINCNPIGDILRLIPYSDHVKKMCANCVPCLNEKRMLNPAPFTILRNNNTENNDTGTPYINIGSQPYTPVCRRCKNILTGE